MRSRAYICLILVGLAVALAAAWFEAAPGYMDAEYYFMGGLRLAQGHGFSEMVMWNYLGLERDEDVPVSLPQPSHAYWMPLTSIVAFLGMLATGQKSFFAARLAFLLLAAVTPALTAALAHTLHKRANLAFLSGLLAAFPAFYLPYLVTTDAFGPCMLLGVIFLWTVQRAAQRGLVIWWMPVILGFAAGAMHLGRADGALWLMLALLFGIEPGLGVGQKSDWIRRFQRMGLCLIGYLFVMGPWMLRNLAEFGALFAPGGGRALWFTDYNELFAYPASLLTWQRWWASGIGNILQARMWALGINAQTAVAVQWEVFLAPLILWGLWKMRREAAVRWGLLAWLLTLLAMTLAFPFAGARGGFFHSGAALQPLFWAAAPVGLEAFVSWAARVRRWRITQAWQFFQAGTVGLAILLTVFMSYNRLVGSQDSWTWNRGYERYARLAEKLEELGSKPTDVVMVNNAPGYFVACGQAAISIPFGDLDVLRKVAWRIGARFLIIEMDQIQGVELHAYPADQPGLKYLGEFEKAQIYRIQENYP